MNTPQNDGGAAFPMHERDDALRGMSLRDWFAGEALTKASQGSSKTADDIAKRAYYIADAMIAERNRLLSNKTKI
jgi:hypothetical protein